MSQKLPKTVQNDIIRPILLLLLAISPAWAIEKASEVTRKFRVGGGSDLQLKLPQGWRDSIKSSPANLAPTIEISPATGNLFKILITAIPPSLQKIPLTDLKSAVQQLSAPAVAQSVEKKAEIKPLKGEQADGYYYSVTDSAPAPGEYVYMSQGLSAVGDLLLSFTILSNDRTHRIQDAGLELIKASLQVKPPPEIDIPILGQDWNLHIFNPGLGPIQKQLYGNQFVCRSQSADGFNLSLFVEKPSGKGTEHIDVFNHYWPLAKRNPLIEPESIKVEKRDNFVKVSYLVASMPHVNYYFFKKGRWADLHISKLPFNKQDEQLFTAFEKTISY